MNALQLCCCENFVTDFLQAKCNFTRKTAVCVFAPFRGLRGNI